nr:hypothetical protein [uncultured bacterium]
MKRAALLVSAFLAMALADSADAQAPAPGARTGLEQVRHLYYEAVQSERAIARGLAEVERQRAHARDERVRATLTAYVGAFTLLRAKHGVWPPDRLRHTRNGLAVLDSLIAAHPDHAEARYLRLMSCYYLPGILGRGWSVRDDFAALARLLPSLRAQYPPDLYRAIVQFVLQKGSPTREQRTALEASLRASLAGG